MRLLIFTLLASLLPVISAFALPPIPDELIDDNGQVCVSKPAGDGCNSCILDWIQGYGWTYSCTELGCPIGLGPKSIKCHKYLPLSAFDLPALKGKKLKNCSQAVLANSMCELGFDTNEGIQWGCQKHQEPINVPFDEPLCIENLSGKIVNGNEIARIRNEIQKRKDAAYQAEMDARPLCVRYEDACNRISPMIFPPQTNQNLAYGSNRAPKYHSEKMRECRKNNPNSKRECVYEITYGELPPIAFDNERHWLSRNKGIKLKDNCVRYENDCFAYYIALSENSEGLQWAWFPKQKNCPKDAHDNGGNDAPMKCTSFYQED